MAIKFNLVLKGHKMPIIEYHLLLQNPFGDVVVVVPIYLLNCVVTEVISPVSSNISENKIR